MIHNKQAEHTQNKLREREQKRVMSLYNPNMLRKAALQMDDEDMKNRILHIGKLIDKYDPKASND